MRIPRSADKLRTFARDLVEECRVSVDNRRERAAFWQNLYFTGQIDGIDAKFNKCFSHINKLASHLFAASEVRFAIDFEGDDAAEWSERARTAARILNKAYKRAKIGSYMSLGVLQGIIDGCCFLKETWNRARIEPHIVRQHFMGVLREDVDELERQEAFTHSFYLTKSQFTRLIAGNADKNEIMKNVRGAFSPANSDVLLDSYFHEIISGGIQPIGLGAPTGAMGQVQVFSAPPIPQLSIEIAQDLVRVDDLWVWNDSQEDWTTLRCVEENIIEGRYRLANLSDAPRKLPFTKISANDIPNYFWGRSELAAVARAQAVLNGRINDVDHIFRLQSKPPKALSGFTGIAEEKQLALLTAGGIVVSDNPNARAESLAPQMPQNAIEYIREVERWFDEQGGFTPILSGQGDAGVRSGAQANTLLRTSSPRLRDRAYAIEEDVAESGNIALAILRAKDPTVQRSGESGQFMLSQLPDDASVRVDSHSASPVFAADNANMAFALMKVGAIDGEDLLEMLQPPNTEGLVRKYRQREKARAKFIQDHPEVLSKAKPGPKPSLAA